MNYYFTFYEGYPLIHNPLSEKRIKLYEYCFNSFLQYSNKECLILTNEEGAFLLKKYTNILNRYIIVYKYPLHNQYQQVWSLPKLYAYKYVCNIGHPFVFFDLDILMKSEIPKNFLLHDIVVYEHIRKLELKDWNLNFYFNFLKKTKSIKSNEFINNFFEKINYDFYKIKIPNCAVFGGTNLNKINNYVDFAINHCLDIGNIEYWRDDFFKDEGFQKACILEQFLLAVINFNKNFTFLTNEFVENNVSPPILHIGHYKYFIEFKEFEVSNIISTFIKLMDLNSKVLSNKENINCKFSETEKKIARLIIKSFKNKYP